jgi:hypothetical protein
MDVTLKTKKTDGMLDRKKRTNRPNAAKPIGAYNLRFEKMSIYRAFAGWSCSSPESEPGFKEGRACYFNAFP